MYESARHHDAYAGSHDVTHLHNADLVDDSGDVGRRATPAMRKS
jgi:hypothetical protein